MVINMQSGGVVPESIKDAAIITPGTQKQVINAGTYLRGAQTILGDADLIAKNIRKGTNIFGVVGTLAENPDLLGELGYSKFAVDKITLTSDSDYNPDPLTHSLGVTPKFALLVFKGDIPTSGAIIWAFTMEPYTDSTKKYSVNNRNVGSNTNLRPYLSTIDNAIFTESKVKFAPWALSAGTYTLITMA